MFFFENSTRTKLSFELAEKRLSADVVNFSASSSSLSKGETLVDTINNILAMKVDLVVMRHPHPGACHLLAQKVDVKIVNAGDGAHEHPTQALLDTYSIREKLGKIKGKKVAIVGDILHSRVALSNIYALQKLGAEVTLCGPKTLIPQHAESLGVKVDLDFDRVIQNNDVLNMLRVQNERMNLDYFPSNRDYVFQYGLTEDRFNKSENKPLIMHPGPINRGVEISSEVADSSDAIILNQVENGVAVRMSVLYLLASKMNIV